jgi:hypothetical protein
LFFGLPKVNKQNTEFFEAQEVTQDMGTLPEKAELFFPWHLGHVRGSTLYIS